MSFTTYSDASFYPVIVNENAKIRFGESGTAISFDRATEKFHFEVDGELIGSFPSSNAGSAAVEPEYVFQLVMRFFRIYAYLGFNP